jgi:fumarate reductase flavoprotein subunit
MRLFKSAYDVVIVGGGAAGLAAYATSVHNGFTTVLLEKESMLGGTTVYAIGSVTASNTFLQEKKGISDTIDDFFEDLVAASRIRGVESSCEKDFLQLYAEEAGKTVNWIEGIGVVFVGPSPETPHRVPRMHNAVPSAFSYIYRLKQYGSRRGGKIIKSFRVSELVREEDGNISGVIGTGTRGEIQQFSANKGVVIATGPFSSNNGLLKELVPKSAETEAVNPKATGDGVTMCRRVGAAIKNADVESTQFRFGGGTTNRIGRLAASWLWPRLFGWMVDNAPDRITKSLIVKLSTSYTAPSSKIFEVGGILVNSDGNRFVNELSEPYPYALAKIANTLSKKDLYILFDSQAATRLVKWPYYISTFPGISYAYLEDYLTFRRDVISRSGTIDALARKAGIDSINLKSTVDHYNDYATDSCDQDFARKELHPIDDAPFYLLGPIKPVITVTEGGIAINTKCQALDAKGNVIRRLYVVGDGSAGPLNVSHGMHIGWALTSGRLSVEAMLEEN